MSLLREGENCWLVTRAQTVAFLVDGEEFYPALIKALQLARERIDVLGWDIHSDIRLVPDEGRRSPKLGKFFRDLLALHPMLRARFLIWAAPPIYKRLRDRAAKAALEKDSGGRAELHYDAEHPLGASHHQKVIVIDEAVAFVGSTDLTGGRWDTRNHFFHEDRRRLPQGKRSYPNHEVQVCLTGDAAVAMSQLFHERWKWATGIQLQPLQERKSILPDLAWHIHDARIGIARTYPEYRGRTAVRESCALYCDLIRDAKHHLFIENQYLNSTIITDVLEDSLREKKGPEITIVVPRTLRSGFINVLMEILRAQSFVRLAAADKHGRLLLLYPHLRGSLLGLYVHSKVLVADDRYAVIGSSNCSDRSMGLDSECDIVIDSEGRSDVRRAIADFRDGLLAEHSGLSLTAFRDMLERAGSLRAFVKHRNRRRKSLRLLKIPYLPWWQRFLMRFQFIDSAETFQIDQVIDGVDEALIQKEPSALSRRLILLYGVAVGTVVVLLTLWWVLGGLSHLSQAEEFLLLARGHPFSPLIAVVLFVLGGALFIPYNALTLVIAAVFPPRTALPVILGGGVFSAVTFYVVGRILGTPILEKFFSKRIATLGKLLRHQKLSTIAILRFIPIAPFTVVNALAGAFKVPFWNFTVGTLLGLFPGALVLVVFQRSLISVLTDPSLGSAVLLVCTLLFILSVLWFLRRRMGPLSGQE